MLSGRTIVVAMGGGIAAFKAVGVVRELQRRGASVRVAMTRSATRFVGPITLTGLTGQPAVHDLWDPSYRGEVHVQLGEADAIVVAPATMNLLARATAGLADDVVLATLACARGPILYAPAMHTRMWTHPSTQTNVATLKTRGARFVGPDDGMLASGESGAGRMAEPLAIADATEALFASETMAGKRVLITAGPTHEDLDPVRFLGNRSTGRMGYALAEEAAARGADVVLISGPTSLQAPSSVRLISVRSAQQMHDAVQAELPSLHVAIMAAAVADYRPKEHSAAKRKKTDGPLMLELVRNPDILAGLGASRSGPSPVLVGFALETEDVLAHARGKLERKKVDLIVANHAADSFGKESNVATLVSPEGDEALGHLSKRALSARILDRVQEILRGS